MVFENILKFEFNQILFVQNSLKCIEPLLSFVSEYISPSRVLYYLGPMQAVLWNQPIVDVMLTTAIGEFLGHALKLITSEHRPFWWIQETKIFSGLVRPEMQQFRQTCETTSGNPSGHSLSATVFFYSLTKYIMEYLINETDLDLNLIKSLSYLLFGVSILAMWTSRMYFGCHFLHQCILGTCLGILICNTLDQEDIKNKLYSINKKGALLIALGCSGVIGVLYLGMIILGVDPQWAVKMAFKWCKDPQNLKHETTAVYSFTKVLGIFFGIAASAPLEEKTEPLPSRWLSVPATILSVAINHVLLTQTPKSYGRFVFLSYTFFVNVFFSFSLLTIVPKLCNAYKNKID